jgi:hypothetical protein
LPTVQQDLFSFINIFEVLIETIGGDVNIQDSNKDTPLHQTLCSFNANNGGNIAVLMYLLSQKHVHANINGYNSYTFLHLACTCDISGFYGVSDSSDELDDGASNLGAKSDTVLSQIVEIIAERRVQGIFDESSFNSHFSHPNN